MDLVSLGHVAKATNRKRNNRRGPFADLQSESARNAQLNIASDVPKVAIKSGRLIPKSVLLAAPLVAGGVGYGVYRYKRNKNAVNDHAKHANA
jgi:hypothetical protein